MNEENIKVHERLTTVEKDIEALAEANKRQHDSIGSTLARIEKALMGPNGDTDKGLIGQTSSNTAKISTLQWVIGIAITTLGAAVGTLWVRHLVQ